MRTYIVIAALLAVSPAFAANISAQESGRHIGETVTVEGVAHVHVASSAPFLDIGAEYRPLAIGARYTL